MFYPEEMETGNDVRHRRDGLLLAKDTLRSFRRIVADTGLSAKLPFAA